MSLPINLLITTLLIYVVGAFISLAVRRNEQLSINISCPMACASFTNPQPPKWLIVVLP